MKRSWLFGALAVAVALSCWCALVTADQKRLAVGGASPVLTRPAEATPAKESEADKIAQKLATEGEVIVPPGHHLDTPGETGANPINVTLPPVVLDWPYVVNGTTCGMGNDYWETCLDYYDGGEDIIYQVNITSAVTVDISLTSDASWVGMCIDNVCPPGAGCIALCTTSGSGCSMNGVSLAVGTYYIMIDTWPSPNCIPNFTLTISEAQPPPECPAGSLFAQTPTLPSGAWSFYVSDASFPYLVYDNFWGLTAYICNIHFWGFMLHYEAGWYDCPTENPMTFQINFYQDAAGTPGALVQTYTLPILGTSTGLLYSGFPLYYFSTAVMPNVGIPYGWVSIQGVSTGSPDCAFLWMNSPYGDLVSYQFDGTSMNPLNTDLAFCLTGEGELLGACCDPYTGNCQGGVPISACPSPSLFYTNTLCAQLDPPCGLGACCDNLTGACEVTNFAGCLGPNLAWLPQVPCGPNPCPPAGENSFTEECETATILCESPGTIEITFTGNKENCGNAELRRGRINPTTVETWNWNVRGSQGFREHFEEGNDVRRYAVPEASEGLYTLHNNNHAFHITWRCIPSKRQTSPSNPEDYAGFPMGSREDTTDLGDIVADSVTVNQGIGMHHGDVPQTIGAGGVGQLFVNFGVPRQNYWWEAMEFWALILSADPNSMLRVQCTGADSPDVTVPIPGGGEYAVNLGAIADTGAHVLTLTGLAGSVTFDCWALRTTRSTACDTTLRAQFVTLDCVPPYDSVRVRLIFDAPVIGQYAIYSTTDMNAVWPDLSWLVVWQGLGEDGTNAVTFVTTEERQKYVVVHLCP
jgi:hypothetical protein